MNSIFEFFRGNVATPIGRNPEEVITEALGDMSLNQLFRLRADTYEFLQAVEHNFAALCNLEAG